MELPVITTDAPGCREPVVHDVTGVIAPVRDAAALEQAVRRYAEHPETARAHGVEGRNRVLREFRQSVIWDGTLAVYHRLLGHPRPEAHSSEGARASSSNAA